MTKIQPDRLYICIEDHSTIDRVQVTEVSREDDFNLDTWVVHPSDIYHFTAGEYFSGMGIIEHLNDDHTLAHKLWRLATKEEEFLHKLGGAENWKDFCEGEGEE